MYIVCTLVAAGILLLDMFTKTLAIEHLTKVPTLPVIKNVFHLTYCENTGAAFSMFSGKPYILAVISLVLVAILVGYIALKKPKSRVLMLSLTAIAAGGLGNIIDRFTRGFVVDFFDFRLINFAIFNVADIAVCCGVVLLGIYLFFIQDKMGQKNDIQN